MTVLRTWSGDGLSAGALTTSSAGTGDDPFDTFIGTGQNIVATGPRSPQIEFDQVAATASAIRWTITSQTQGSGRVYVTTPSAWPSASFPVALLIGSATQVFRLDLGGSGSPGQIRLRNGTTQLQASANNVVTTSHRYRFEWIIDHGADSAEAKVFDGDTTTALVTLTQSSAGSFGTAHDTVSFGNSATTPTVGAWQVDDLAVADAATYIGAAVVLPPADYPRRILSGGSWVDSVRRIWDGSTWAS